MGKVKFSHMVQTRCACGFIVLCAIGARASTLPPDPNNAALLYYQAFLLRPEPDYAVEQLIYNTRMEEFKNLLRGGKLEFGTDTEEQIRRLEEELNDPNKVPLAVREMMPEGYHEVYIDSVLRELEERREYERRMRGVDPNQTVRDYMKKCREAIELAQAASELTECDWGLRYSRGATLSMPQLMEIRELGAVLRTDALLHAADRDYRTAFERCLMIRRFARHIGDDGIFAYTTSTRLGSTATHCIRILLGDMEPAVDALTCLKGKLAAEAGSPPSFARALRMEMELSLRSLRANKEALKKVRDEFVEKAGGQSAGKKIDDLTDEEFIVLIRKPYADSLSSILRAADQNAPYSEKFAEMQRLADEFERQFQKYSFIHMVVHGPESVPSLYTHDVVHRAHFTVFMAGIEIHLVKARTGELPKELPADLPKDPFSGKDFTYKVIDDGFELSFPDGSAAKSNSRPYQFKVHK